MEPYKNHLSLVFPHLEFSAVGELTENLLVKKFSIDSAENFHFEKNRSKIKIFSTHL